MNNYPKLKGVLLWQRDLSGVKCDPVGIIDDELRVNVLMMKDIMYEHNGVGLAAPQVGWFERLAVVGFYELRLVLINPVLKDQNGDVREMERCLSLPGCQAIVSRPKEIQVEFTDIDGNRKEVELRDMEARVVMHELDHLDGKFYVDRLGRVARDLAIRHYRKHVQRVGVEQR